MNNATFAYMGMLLGGLSASMVMSLMFLLFVLWVLLVIAHWRMFTKAGEPGWKSIIPVYADYTLIKLVWSTKGFWIYMGLGALAFVLNGLSGQFATDAAGQLVAGATNPVFSILSTVASIALIVCSFVISAKTALAYSKGPAFAIGLVLLPNVFTLILAFGSAKYRGPQA